MDDELDPNKMAETAIGVFIGVLAFKIVKSLSRGSVNKPAHRLCEKPHEWEGLETVFRNQRRRPKT